MKPPFPSMTPTWHNDTYAAISPSRPNSSVKGKTVVITGAGSGIGRETAFAFAAAGAAHIALLGRSAEKLSETAAKIGSAAGASTHIADVLDAVTLTKAATAIGTWDILIINAGYMPSLSSIMAADPEDWWKALETNVKGSMLTARAFIPTASATRPVILGISTGAISLPPAVQPFVSSYVMSKLAQVSFFEWLAAETPQAFVATMHPGVIETAMSHKAGNVGKLPMDTVQLPAHFLVWLASEEAGFLRGKFVWANWDKDELVSKAEEISQGSELTTNVVGWPYPCMG